MEDRLIACRTSQGTGFGVIASCAPTSVVDSSRAGRLQIDASFARSAFVVLPTSLDILDGLGHDEMVLADGETMTRRRLIAALDLGGVLTTDPIETTLDLLSARHGLATEEVDRVRKQAWKQVAHGPPTSIPDEQRVDLERSFWGELIIKPLGLTESPESLATLLRNEATRLLDPKWPETLAELQNESVEFAILSNNVAFTYDVQMDLGLRPFFNLDHVFLSCNLGCSKSAGARFFQRALDELAVDPRDCLYFDDRLHNLTAAASLDIAGVHVPEAMQQTAAYVARIVRTAMRSYKPC